MVEFTEHEINKKLSEKEKKALDRMKKLSSSAFANSNKYFHDRAKFRRIYMNDLDVEKADWQAQIAHPLPHLSIERLASFMTDAVIGSASKPLFKVRPWNNMEATRKALANTRYMQQQQASMNLTETFYLAFKNMYIDGTSVLHTYWDHEVQTFEQEPIPQIFIKRDENGFPLVDDLGRPQLEIKKVPQPPLQVPIKDTVGVESVDINDFWPDPAATSLEDARFVCRRRFLPWKLLKDMENKGRLKNVDLLKGTRLNIRERINQRNRTFGRFSNYSQFREEKLQEYYNADPENPIIEVIEFYEPGKVSIFGNDSVPLDLDRPVYRSRYPFTLLRNLPQQGCLFGLSHFQICERIFTYVNQMQNMIWDNWEKHLKGITLVEGSISDVSFQQLLEGNPGDVIRISNINGVRTERPGLMDSSVIQGMQILLQECKDAMSVDGAITGASPGSEVRDQQSFEIFTRISQVTLSVTVRRMTESLRDLGRQWLALNKQFLDDKIKVRIAGPLAQDTIANEELTIDPRDPNDLPFNADVDVQLSAIADVRKDRETKEMVDAINLAIQDPTFKSQEALLQLFSRIDAFDDALALFETDPQKVLRNAQVQALAAGRKTPVLASRFGESTQPNGIGVQ